MCAVPETNRAGLCVVAQAGLSAPVAVSKSGLPAPASVGASKSKSPSHNWQPPRQHQSMEEDDTTGAGQASASRPICSYGSDCYRLNPDHLKYKAHPHLEKILPCYTENPDNISLDVLIFRPGLDDQYRAQLDILAGFAQGDVPSPVKKRKVTDQSESEDPHTRQNKNGDTVQAEQAPGAQGLGRQTENVEKPPNLKATLGKSPGAASSSAKGNNSGSSLQQRSEAEDIQQTTIAPKPPEPTRSTPKRNFPEKPADEQDAKMLRGESECPGGRMSQRATVNLAEGRNPAKNSLQLLPTCPGPMDCMASPGNGGPVNRGQRQGSATRGQRQSSVTRGQRQSSVTRVGDGRQDQANCPRRSLSLSRVSVNKSRQQAKKVDSSRNAHARNETSSSQPSKDSSSVHYHPNHPNQHEAAGVEDTLQGEIVGINLDKKFGFIRPSLPLPEQFSQKDVYFKFGFVRNHAAEADSLQIGLQVRFSLDKKEQSRPRAKAVHLDGIQASQEQLKISSGWMLGKVCKVFHEKKFVFLQNCLLPGEGPQVFLHMDKISSFSLPLQVDDLVEFLQDDKNPAKPCAMKAKQHKFVKRSTGQIVGYLDFLMGALQTPEVNCILIEISPLAKQWQFIGNTTDKDGMVLLKVLQFLSELTKQSGANKTMLTELISCLLQGSLVAKCQESGFGRQADTGHSAAVIADLERLSDTCIQLVKNWPKLACQARPLVKLAASYGPSLECQDFLLELFHHLSMTESAGNSSNVPTEEWRSIPPIPTTNELDCGMVQEEGNLLPVQTKTPYSSGPDYMNTYYRLLRAECFHKIQKGIQDLKADRLDERDMTCFYEVHLAGVEISHTTFSFGLSFQTNRQIKDWEKTPLLMYGNLLCISPSQNFDDVIWATVSNRDPVVLKNSQTIFVEICDITNRKTSEIIQSLKMHGGQTIMVESPTYFNAFKPVLSCFRKLDVETFGLFEEIVYANVATGNVPPSFKFLQEDVEDSNGKIVAARTDKILDPAQKEAFHHCLENCLSIVQGPPGCGKTFLGSKIIEVLLNCPQEKPILVITYKNHALDEFLKHVSKICGYDNLVRIGGRSKDPALQACNIKELSRTGRKSHNIYGQIIEVKEDIRETTRKVTDMILRYNDGCSITKQDLLLLLSESQLENLLLTTKWKKHESPKKAWIKQKVLPFIMANYGSLQEFLSNGMSKTADSSKPLEVLCYQQLLEALDSWLPSMEGLRLSKGLEAQFTVGIESYLDNSQDTDQSSKSVEETEEDAEEIKRDNEARMLEAKSNISNGERILFPRKNPNEVISSLSDFPRSMALNSQLLNASNLLCLNLGQKYQFLFAAMVHGKEDLAAELDQELENLQTLIEKKGRLERSSMIEEILARKVVGATITGASIHHDIIDGVRPQIVIVEEAAEILEPSLVAALNPDVKHLILIGDHQQLRPQVESYTLQKDFSFDVSMMERLITTGFPFKSLRTQNRMRPEFSVMLKDIYYDLMDNLARVQHNKTVDCIGKSMFFWSHRAPEDSEKKEQQKNEQRSKMNTAEAEMVIALLLFMLANKVKPGQVTILSAYLGQVKLIKRQLRQAQATYPQLFSSGDNFVQVQTIDMYQGDENEFVIVSLVRSNQKGSVGFVNSLNRRCVAQSRAKCGLYFVGNDETITSCKKAVWNKIVQHMSAEGCLGTRLPVQCNSHREQSQIGIENSTQLLNLVKNPGQLCRKPCLVSMPCEVHPCEKPCLPFHNHDRCKKVVKETTYPECGHTLSNKLCFEDIRNIPCETKVPIMFPCKHGCMKKCHVNPNKLVCQKPCTSKMNCALHACPRECGHRLGHSVVPPHTHNMCKVKVGFTFSKCGHKGEKMCYEEEDQISCNEKVSVTLGCMHQMEKICSVPLDQIHCTHPCQSLMKCGQHKCREKCGSVHNHDKCTFMIKYRFPLCNHQSPKKKECSELINWKCWLPLPDKCLYGHPIQRPCCQSVNEVLCTAPCGKIRKCKHPCANKCHEPCEKGTCGVCKKVHDDNLDKFRVEARKRLIELGKVTNKSCSFQKLEDKGDTKAEYKNVEDRVLKYIQEMHQWTPRIKEIQKVSHPLLQERMERAKTTSFGTLVDLKFHGTSDEGIRGITQNGFRTPGPPSAGQRPGMYGQGIYFATDSSKSAQEIYTKGSNKLLLCEVLLGRSKVVTKADSSICQESLKREGYDSVYAPRGSQVKNDEFVIFNKDHAIPKYIIHYDTNQGIPRLNKSLSTKDFEIIRLQDSRNFDEKVLQFKIAEGHFMSMNGKMSRYSTGIHKEINHIDYVANKKLNDKYEAKKQEFVRKNIPSEEILAFHATNPSNVDSILRTNLDWQRSAAHGRAHGDGVYFSEFPNFSLEYGNALICFAVLPGKEYSGQGRDVPSGYNSKKVNATGGGYGEQLIIKDSAQFVPRYRYHFK